MVLGGFPLPTFSALGLQEGLSDSKERGRLVESSIEYIRVYRPAAFVLENVKGILRIDDGKVFDCLISTLSDDRTYDVVWELINTNQHGVPHSRPSVYIVGLRSWRSTFRRAGFHAYH